MHLADQVEELFIKNFAEDDRTKAMKYLKPHQRKDTHTKTFFVGQFFQMLNTHPPDHRV